MPQECKTCENGAKVKAGCFCRMCDRSAPVYMSYLEVQGQYEIKQQLDKLNQITDGLALAMKLFTESVSKHFREFANERYEEYWDRVNAKQEPAAKKFRASLKKRK